MKTKRISLSMLSILIAVCCVALLGVVMIDNANMAIASAAAVNSNDDVNYDEYTDSDTVQGSTKTIRDYANSLHHSTVQ